MEHRVATIVSKLHVVTSQGDHAWGTCAGLHFVLPAHLAEQAADGEPLRRLALAVAAHQHREGHVVRLQQAACMRNTRPSLPAHRVAIATTPLGGHMYCLLDIARHTIAE